MISPEEKIRIIQGNNPFTSSSTGDPWIKKFPDVASVNRTAFCFLNRSIQQKERDPSSNFACLVLGEAGSGKTHLISRLLEHSNGHKLSYLFAYIQPIEDPDQTFRYLLREIVINLGRPMGKHEYTQLDILLGLILKEVLRKKVRIKKDNSTLQDKFIRQLESDPLAYLKSKVLFTVFKNELIGKASRDFLMSKYPNIDEAFLRILFQYRLPEKRSAALSWLKGAVLDDDNNHLLSIKGRDTRTEKALEQEAQGIIISIGLLLARYGFLLVTCFDRLENLGTPEQIESFGKMIEFLVDSTLSTLPVAFFRGQLWEEVFRKRLNDHVVSRLETNKILLEACDTEQALAIIHSRLSTIYSEEVNNDYYPFSREELTTLFDLGRLSPREIIIEANRLLTEKISVELIEKSESPEERLFSDYNHQFQENKKNLSNCPSDRNRLRHTLMLYLSNIPPNSGFEILEEVQEDERKEHIDYACQVRYEDSRVVNVAFIIDVSLHHKSVNAKLKKGIAFLKKYAEGKVFYIRENRCKFPGPDVWKATNRTLNDFKAIGGIVVKLSKDQVAAWYALTFLHYKIKEGDSVVNSGEKHARSITSEEFDAFIKKVLHQPTSLSFADLDKHILKPRTNRQRKKRAEKLSVLDI